MAILSTLFSDTYKQLPIAIYDSGIGGLPIAKVIKTILPEESIHYIADTKNLPYGEKTSMALSAYIKEVLNFCLKKRYKLLVIACNTATAAGNDFLPSYLKKIRSEMGIVNVIDPVISYIHATNRYNQIGLIGTKYTVRHGIYAEKLRSMGISLSALATPLLVPMVEATFNGGKVDHLLLDHYLSQIVSPNLDALIPACTHYLFLDEALKNFLKSRYRKKIEVINVARITALAVKEFLTVGNLLNHTTKRLSDCFMATELTPAFKNATKELFGENAIEINLADATKTLSHSLIYKIDSSFCLPTHDSGK